MKRIELMRLELSNFKGIRSLKFEANGANVAVFGDNATGKTTIFDAFTWLLFDKDSADKKDFQLKTVDAEGNEINHLDHSVAGSFAVDSWPIELRKVFHEKWTKKRGSAAEQFSGHTTDYFLDGVPAKKKEYDQAVSNLVSGNEDLFKLLTSPVYFNEQLNWKQRRKVLLGVCGDLTDDEVIDCKKELADLPGILDGRSIEDYRKILAAKLKEINKQLETMPIRIDEADKSKPDLAGQSEADLKKQADQLQQQIDQVDEEINRIRSGGEIDEKRNEIRRIEGEQLDIKNNFQTDLHKKADQKRSEYYELKQSIDDIKREIGQNSDQIKQKETLITINTEKAEQLRIDWANENKKTFDFDEHKKVCPTCGQDLPPEQVEEARTKAKKAFNHEKAEKLQAITEHGKQLMKEAESANEEVFSLNAMNDRNKEEIEWRTKNLENIKKELDELKSGMKSILDDSEYQKRDQKIHAIKKEIADLQTSVDDAILDAGVRKQELKRRLSNVEMDLAKFDQIRRIDKRIAELKAQEKELAKAFERTEYELNLTDVFVRTKVDLLESRINSKFKMARFKLFSEQINGGLQEVCETTYRGVPYNALNNAARINVGLDIINTLSEFYSLSAPIFIDNREAVTKLIDIDAQIISLIVSAADKQLRIEKEKEPLMEGI